MKTSELDGRVRIFFTRALEELKFALVNMDTFGFESAWAEGSANLVGGARRFRNGLQSNPALRQSVVATAWQVMRFLAAMHGAKDGAVAFTEAAQALFGGASATEEERPKAVAGDCR